MPQITTLITGAAVLTIVPGQAQMENLITIGDCDTANPLQGFQVEIEGTSFINIPSPNAALCSAFFKWLSQMSVSSPSSVIKLGTGKVQRSTTYRLTNAGATTPAIFATSDAPDGVPFLAGTKTINATSYDDFRKFSALFLATPANVSQAEILFTNGLKAIYAGVELDSLYSIKRPTDVNGQLSAVSVIDNTDQSIDTIRIFTTATALTVLVVKLPDASYEVMKQQAETFLK